MHACCRQLLLTVWWRMVWGGGGGGGGVWSGVLQNGKGNFMKTSGGDVAGAISGGLKKVVKDVMPGGPLKTVATTGAGLAADKVGEVAASKIQKVTTRLRAVPHRVASEQPRMSVLDAVEHELELNA